MRSTAPLSPFLASLGLRLRQHRRMQQHAISKITRATTVNGKYNSPAPRKKGLIVSRRNLVFFLGRKKEMENPPFQLPEFDKKKKKSIDI